MERDIIVEKKGREEIEKRKKVIATFVDKNYTMDEKNIIKRFLNYLLKRSMKHRFLKKSFGPNENGMITIFTEDDEILIVTGRGNIFGPS